MLQIAWRNIWRIPRRTLIILAAIMLGVWSMIVMSGMILGMINQMINSNIQTLVGHLQIHEKGFLDDPVIDHSILDPAPILKALEDLPPEIRWTKRIKVPGIVSNARNSSGVTIVGIVPETEAHLSFFQNSIVEGETLVNHHNHGILIGKKLAEKFDTGLNKKLVLMSQDYEGEIASAGFRIRGIFKAELETTEEQFVFITLPSAQEMLKLGEGLSEFAFLSSDQKMIPSVQKRLIEKLDNGYEILNWKELLPLIMSQLEMTSRFSLLWYFVTFVAMAFGLVNTLLMAVFERIREFGMLKALGMKPRLILTQILLESLYLLVIGLVLGNLLGLGTIEWLSYTGIDLSAFSEGTDKWGISRIIYPVFNTKDMIAPNILVLTLGIFVSLYPAWKASRITPIQALQHI